MVLIVVALIVGAIVITVMKKKSDSSDDGAAPVPGPPGAISQNYADALKVAMQFFDIQKCNALNLLSCIYLHLRLRATVWKT